MKPFFNYYGGKQRMASWICSKMPKHTVYVEPFCGSAAVMFRKGVPDVSSANHYREVINDKNELVYNFYKVLRDNPKPLLHKMKYSMHSRRLFEDSQKIFEPNSLSDVDKAYYMHVNISLSFGGMLNGSFGVVLYGDNMASSTLNRRDHVVRNRKRIEKTVIENLDALEIIKKYDSPQTLFYIDPPYTGADQGPYSGFTEKDMFELTDLIDTIDGAFLLSTYSKDIKFKSRVKKFWKRAHCTVSCKGKTRLQKRRPRQAPEQADLGDRERVEYLYLKHSIRPRAEILKIYKSKEFNRWSEPDYIDG